MRAVPFLAAVLLWLVGCAGGELSPQDDPQSIHFSPLETFLTEYPVMGTMGEKREKALVFSQRYEVKSPILREVFLFQKGQAAKRLPVEGEGIVYVDRIKQVKKPAWVLVKVNGKLHNQYSWLWQDGGLYQTPRSDNKFGFPPEIK